MKKSIVSIFAICFLAVTCVFAQADKAKIAAPVGTWNADASHSNVKFTVTHLVISEVDGVFKKFEGSIKNKTADFNGSYIEFAVDVASVFTDNDMRDGHLKGDEFFSADKYPKMAFKSTSFTKKGAGKFVLVGNLTIKDVTQKVTFAVTHGGVIKDPWGNTKAGFKAITTISRKSFNLKWNNMTEAGGVVLGDNVNITLNLEFALAK